MKKNRLRRNLDIQRDYRHMYDVEGKRHARILKELSEKYYLSEGYIGDIICMELPIPQDQPNE